MTIKPGRPAENPQNLVAKQPAWHALPAEQALEQLGVTAQGLSAHDVAARQAADGLNELPQAPPPHPLLRFLSQFNNTLIYFLLAAGVVAGLLGHLVDAGVIVAVVLINAVVGFVQEGQAEKALDSIRDMIAPHARVIRDGAQQDVDAREVVAGDIVYLEAGDMIPADIRLIAARNVLANESTLTGEAVPAEKSVTPVAADAPLGDRFSMLYSGTIMATGQATGIAVATGARTEIGHISTMLRQVPKLTTPLLVQINRFGTLFTWFAMAAAAVLLAFTMLVAGYQWVDALMVVVALAVSAIPEGLPAVITITLALGVQRMARRNAVVRRLPAVETLGSTTVICSDKTGTLTKNEMTACRIVTADADCKVTGTGYAPEGAIAGGDASDPVRQRFLKALLLCNDAQLNEAGGRWSVLGDPMEGALVTLAMKAGLSPDQVRSACPRLDAIPFDAEHRFMATLNDDPATGGTVFVKGAPEKVLAMCATQATGTAEQPLDLDLWHQRIANAASNGERVLGFATGTKAGDEQLSFANVQDGLVFLGIVGFIDPPRDEAISAVAACRSAGIAIKMITGDHGETAAAIARQIAIADNPRVVTGAEVAQLSDEDLKAVANDASVFARTSPEDKLRIVRALQALGNVVAMTGDGVNDAPSLKQADVGIAMGRKGTEAAKEAAEMVLVDDNFATIVAAVKEGRAVYDNIRKVVSWTMPTNGGEVLSVIIAIMFGLALPMSPVQILWINMISSVTLGLALAFEPAEPGIMERAPRAPTAPLISRFLVWRICLVSVLFAIGVFGVYRYAIASGLGEAGARTMVVNALVVMEIFYLFNVRYLHITSFSLIGLVGTPAVLIAVGAITAGQFLFTYAPFMQELFGTVSLSFGDGLIVVGVGVAMMVILELEKLLMRRLGFLDTSE